ALEVPRKNAQTRARGRGRFREATDRTAGLPDPLWRGVLRFRTFIGSHVSKDSQTTGKASRSHSTMTLQAWHLEADTPREPIRVSPHEYVHIHVGTYPVAPEQSVWVTFWTNERPTHPPSRVDAIWERNSDKNSYWKASLGPFLGGEHVTYEVHARVGDKEATVAVHDFRVGPKVHLALLWHMHQPDYRLATESEIPMLELPWVRLHALRDYYSMAALVAEQPDVHLTINLTPVLLEQLQSYASHGATDRHLTLTMTPVDELDELQLERMLETFFDADWHHQIFPHFRYGDLLQKRVRQES